MSKVNRQTPEQNRYPDHDRLFKELLQTFFKRLFKKPTYDHEDSQGVYSTSNLAFRFEVRCSFSFA